MAGVARVRSTGASARLQRGVVWDKSNGMRCVLRGRVIWRRRAESFWITGLPDGCSQIGSARETALESGYFWHCGVAEMPETNRKTGRCSTGGQFELESK